MNARAETTSEVELIDEQAQEWLGDKFHFLAGHQVFVDRDMVTAYRAGFSAGLQYARKAFMAEVSA